MQQAETESQETKPQETEHLVDRRQSWQPLYSRRPVLIAFIVLLGAMVVALEVLFAVSEKHQGLTETYSGLSYLWTYGPTALLTLVHALWNRVDYDTKVTAPWLKADPIHTSQDALLLDYVDMSSVAVPFRALKYRDYPVAACAVISLLFSILTVLSTGLLVLSSVEIVDDSVPITLKSRFIDDPTRLLDQPLYDYSSLPLQGIQGLTYDNLTYPNGCSDQFAYQSFTSNLKGVSELHTTVDGMSLGLDCAQPAFIGYRLGSMFLADDFYSPSDSNITFQYEGCSSTISLSLGLGSASFIETSNGSLQYNTINNNTNTVFSQRHAYLLPVEGLKSPQCGSTDPDHKRLVFVSAEIQYKVVKGMEVVYESSSSYGNSSGIMVQYELVDINATSLVCDPSYSIQTVDVVQNAAGDRSVSRHGNTLSKMFEDIHPWYIIQSYLDTMSGDIGLLYSPSLDADLIVNSALSYVLEACGNACLEFSSLLNATFLEIMLVEYYQKYGAFLFQQSLTEPINVISTATALRTVDRLLVQATGCQSMVGAIVLIMMILIGISFIPTKMFCPTEPGSILATATLAGCLTTSNFPNTLGETDCKTLKTRIGWWSKDAHMEPHSTVPNNPACITFPSKVVRSRQATDAPAQKAESLEPASPKVLWPIFRITFYSLVVGCIVILEVMLQRSSRYQGLKDVQHETYLHYSWTVLPATIFTVLAVLFSSADTETRRLAPYHSLTRSGLLHSSLHLDLLRPFLIPQALHQQLRTRNLSALAISIAALVSSILTISASSLYQPRIFPVSFPVEHRTTSTLSNNTVVPSENTLVPNADLSYATISSLILESNLSYTPLVHENLVLPEVSIEESSAMNAIRESEIYSMGINVRVPALRPQLSCHFYPHYDITTSFVSNYTINSSDNTSYIIEEESIKMIIKGESSRYCPNRYSEDIYAPKSNLTNLTAVFVIPEPLTESLFAKLLSYSSDSGACRYIDTCSYFLYAWGNYSTLSDPPFISASALGCNPTLEIVDVDVSFIGSQLQLNPSRPPRPIESTSRSIPVKTNVIVGEYDNAELTDIIYDTLMYLGLESINPRRNDIVFDSFFEQLVTSRYAIPISTIGDPSQAEVVKDAIIFQHGIIAAQYYNSRYRVGVEVPSNRTNRTTRAIFPLLSNSSSTNDTGMYHGIATNPQGRKRLIQDPASTRVLQALLTFTLVLSLLGWYLGPRKVVLPRTSLSIASVLALLAGGDVLEYMYKDGDGQWETTEDVKAIFPKNCKFWMGWGPPGTSENDAGRRFGIWMMRNQGEEGSEMLDSAAMGDSS
ncbi:hypothetical protein F4819DRAFT_506456 [Hypoxylon fuscum]|nr:hypothetical protein F4819DRAFT_506456 [Hypoxylon fuscum]